MALPKTLVLLITTSTLLMLIIPSPFITCTATSTDYDESSQTTSCPHTQDTVDSNRPCGCGCVMGPPGYPGSVGPPGFPGVQGPQGLTGSMGPKGNPGTDGLSGLKGDKGDGGDKGKPGLDGTKGESGSDGANGARGLKGNKGMQGGGGIKGDTGDTGEEGEAGPPGLNGNKGSKGDKGSIGNQGAKGDPGTPYIPPPLSMFTAHRTSSFSVTSGSKTIDFDVAKVNLGNDFSPTSGVFTCRIPGLYFFAFNFLQYGNSGVVHVYLMRNNVEEAWAYTAYTGGYATVGQSTILDLEEGDEVFLRAHASTNIHSGADGRNIFTGHLLYETKEE